MAMLPEPARSGGDGYQNGLFGRIDDGHALVAGARRAIALVRDHGGTIGYVRVGFADGEARSS